MRQRWKSRHVRHGLRLLGRPTSTESPGELAFGEARIAPLALTLILRLGVKLPPSCISMDAVSLVALSFPPGAWPHGETLCVRHRWPSRYRRVQAPKEKSDVRSNATRANPGQRYFHDGRHAWGLRHPPFSAIMAFRRLPLFAIK